MIHSPLQYIVTGTGRCATLYYSRLLTSVGIPCGHEAVFTPLGLEHALDRLSGRRDLTPSEVSEGVLMPEGVPAAESSYMAAPYLRFFRGVKVIHLVRNPLKVIRSFVDGLGYFRSPSPRWDGGKRGMVDDKYHELIWRYVPELGGEMDPYTRAAIYYVAWNGLIEGQGEEGRYLRHRVEDGPAAVLRFLGADPEAGHYHEEGVNASGAAADPETTVGREAAAPLMEMARRYGYDLLGREIET